MRCHCKSSKSDWTRFLAFWSSDPFDAWTWNLVQSSWSDLNYITSCHKYPIQCLFIRNFYWGQRKRLCIPLINIWFSAFLRCFHWGQRKSFFLPNRKNSSFQRLYFTNEIMFKCPALRSSSKGWFLSSYQSFCDQLKIWRICKKCSRPLTQC
jgi:hypothetical protein